jgi:hypothetical protein
MTDYSVAKNKQMDGGDRWQINGTLEFGAKAVIEGGALVVAGVGALSTAFLHHYSIAPAAKSATGVHAAVTLGADAQTVTTDITNPDVPRTCTVKGNASGIAGNVVITGTNVDGDEITDTIALNGSTEVEGAKAFATVTSILFPAKTNASGDTVSIGKASSFGLPEIVDHDELMIKSIFDGSADAGTTYVDADEVEKNMYTLAGTANGTKVLDLYYIA